MNGRSSCRRSGGRTIRRRRGIGWDAGGGFADQLSELPTAFSRMAQASSPYFFFHSA